MGAASCEKGTRCQSEVRRGLGLAVGIGGKVARCQSGLRYEGGGGRAGRVEGWEVLGLGSGWGHLAH